MVLRAVVTPDMRIKFTITDNSGHTYDGEVELSPARTRATNPPAKAAPRKLAPITAELTFSLNERAFVKKHANGLSGPQKFVLILAYLAKGKVNQDIDLKNIQRHWDRMTAKQLLGCRFNRFYSATAKDNGWVNSPRKGVYALAEDWKVALLKGDDAA